MMPINKPLMAALERHVAEYGATNWESVRRQFDEVSDSTFWRYVRRLKNHHPKGKAVAVAERLEQELSKPAAPRRPAQSRPSKRPARALPTAKTAQIKPVGQLDAMEEMREAIATADAIRDYSKTVDGRIKNPRYLMSSAKLRLDTIRTAVSVMELLVDSERIEKFFSAVVEEVGRESPEAQGRILERLQIINQEFGGAIGLNG